MYEALGALGDFFFKGGALIPGISCLIKERDLSELIPCSFFLVRTLEEREEDNGQLSKMRKSVFKHSVCCFLTFD